MAQVVVTPEAKAAFLKQTERILFVVLLLMVACFFTWSENVAITRVIKVVGRMGVMLSSIWMYRRILRFGAVDVLRVQNPWASGLYYAYLGLGMLSFAWSTNPGFSALQWFMTFQSLVFAYYYTKCLWLLDQFFPGHRIRLFQLLGNSVLVLQLIFIIGMWTAPDVFFRMTNGGEEARLGGTLMNPNELGMLAGVGVACLIFDFYDPKKRVWTVVKLLLLLYALFMTGSRSSLIGAFLIIFFHLNQAQNRWLKIAIVSGILIVAPVAVNKVILKDGNSERLEEIMSMTGRLPFWQALITEGLPREPLLGFGFMRIDYKEFFQSTHTYPGKMTHNTLMQVLMNLGFVGLCIALCQLGATLRAIRRAPLDKRLMLFGIFIPVMINSFTEFGIFGESNYGILFYQLIIYAISFQVSPYWTRQQKAYMRHKRPDWEGVPA